MQEICWSLQYWLSHIIFTEICRISEKSLSSFSMLGIFERTSVSQILYGLYHCGAQTHQISTMPQSSSACWGQDRCRTPAADPDAQHPLAEAYPSLIPVSLGQDQDLNAPSSPPVLPPHSALPKVTLRRALQPAGIEPLLHFWFSGFGCTLKSGLPQWRNVQGEGLAQGLPDSTSGEEMQRKAIKLNISTMWYVILRMDSAGSSCCPAGFLLRVWHPLSGSSYTQR